MTAAHSLQPKMRRCGLRFAEGTAPSKQSAACGYSQTVRLVSRTEPARLYMTVGQARDFFHFIKCLHNFRCGLIQRFSGTKTFSMNLFLAIYTFSCILSVARYDWLSWRGM